MITIRVEVVLAGGLEKTVPLDVQVQEDQLVTIAQVVKKLAETAESLRPYELAGRPFTASLNGRYAQIKHPRMFSGLNHLVIVAKVSRN